MRLKEQKVWDTMRTKAPRSLWLQRVENLVGEGIPDVHSVASGGHLSWIELKAAILPKRPTSKLLGTDGLRQSQINWHVKAASKGAPAYILIRDNKGALYFLHCTWAKMINDMTAGELREKSIAATWEEIFNELHDNGR